MEFEVKRMVTSWAEKGVGIRRGLRWLNAGGFTLRNFIHPYT